MSKKPAKATEEVEKGSALKQKEEVKPNKSAVVEDHSKDGKAGDKSKAPEKSKLQGSPVKGAGKGGASTLSTSVVVPVRQLTGNVLVDSGLIDAYDFFLRQLCKNGLPSGNIFEYAAQEVMRFEKKKMSGPYKKGQQKIDWAKAEAPVLNGTGKGEKVAESAQHQKPGADGKTAVAAGGKAPATQPDPKSKDKVAEVKQPAVPAAGAKDAKQPAPAAAAGGKPEQKAPPAAAKVK